MEGCIVADRTLHLHQRLTQHCRAPTKPCLRRFQRHEHTKRRISRAPIASTRVRSPTPNEPHMDNIWLRRRRTPRSQRYRKLQGQRYIPLKDDNQQMIRNDAPPVPRQREECSSTFDRATCRPPRPPIVASRPPRPGDPLGE